MKTAKTMDAINSKNIFTTGDVAKICQVAPRTVNKWFDSGHLKGYRIPLSGDRRVERAELLRFFRENGLPSFGLEEELTVALAQQQDELGPVTCY
jgi:DNA-binding transcriptional MerR regulator